MKTWTAIWEIALLFLLGSLNHIFRLLLALVLVIGLTSCGGDKAISQPPSLGVPKQTQLPAQLTGKLAEVSPPEVIQELSRSLDKYRPQVKIVSPMNNEVLQTDSLTLGLQVQDLPVFRDPKYGLGPHLHVILDHQSYAKVYDLKQPLKISDLTPGTHTLRVIAEKPWYETFKNDGAYAQVSFHVFTQTDENNPVSDLPLLTYNLPEGDYGAEPILLDFHLSNAPLKASTNSNQKGSINDWRIRCTINGDKFVLDRWQSIYLTGFQKGKNWVQIEFLDDQGEPIKNVFNTTTRTINYQPQGQDVLSKILRRELTVEQVRGIVDPSYNPPEPVVIPTPVVTPEVESTPEPVVVPTPNIAPTIAPESKTGDFLDRFPAKSPSSEQKVEDETTQPTQKQADTSTKLEAKPEPTPDTESTPTLLPTETPKLNQKPFLKLFPAKSPSSEQKVGDETTQPTRKQADTSTKLEAKLEATPDTESTPTPLPTETPKPNKPD